MNEPKSWGESLQKYSYEKHDLHKATMSKAAENNLPLKRHYRDSRFGQHVEQASFNIITAQWKDTDKEHQTRTQELKTSHHNHERAKMMAQKYNTSYNIINNEGGRVKLGTDDGGNRSEYRPPSPTTSEKNFAIYQKKKSDIHNGQGHKYKSNLAHQVEQRDYDIISTRYFKEHQARITDSKRREKEISAAKFWKNNRFNPVVGCFYDKEEEIRFDKFVIAQHQLKGEHRRSRVPYHVQTAEGNMYNTVSLEVTNPALLAFHDEHNTSNRGKNRRGQNHIVQSYVRQRAQDVQQHDEQQKANKISAFRYPYIRPYQIQNKDQDNEPNSKQGQDDIDINSTLRDNVANSINRTDGLLGNSVSLSATHGHVTFGLPQGKGIKNQYPSLAQKAVVSNADVYQHMKGSESKGAYGKGWPMPSNGGLGHGQALQYDIINNVDYYGLNNKAEFYGNTVYNDNSKRATGQIDEQQKANKIVLPSLSPSSRETSRPLDLAVSDGIQSKDSNRMKNDSIVVVDGGDGVVDVTSVNFDCVGNVDAASNAKADDVAPNVNVSDDFTKLQTTTASNSNSIKSIRPKTKNPRQQMFDNTQEVPWSSHAWVYDKDIDPSSASLSASRTSQSKTSQVESFGSLSSTSALIPPAEKPLSVAQHLQNLSSAHIKSVIVANVVEPSPVAPAVDVNLDVVDASTSVDVTKNSSVLRDTERRDDSVASLTETVTQPPIAAIVSKSDPVVNTQKRASVAPIVHSVAPAFVPAPVIDQQEPQATKEYTALFSENKKLYLKPIKVKVSTH